jgi:phosphoribosylaminoimidazole-succinocarboxamide synthase
MGTVVRETHLAGLKVRRGKVRDVYDLGDKLLIVATDRLSAYDVVLPTGIPDKGRILTALSLWWFDFLADVTPNHLITAEVKDMGPAARTNAALLAGRAMLCRKAKVFPIECVVRGYLAGSGWREYQRSGAVCGLKLPAGLKQCDRLPAPIFTPSTKAETGHDENVSFDRAAQVLGKRVAETVRDRSLAVYRKAADYAAAHGILIADTKFEWGEAGGKVILVDEVLTPDSSRFWPADAYEPGHDQPSYDKQFVRNYLDTLDWNKAPPGPELSPDIVEKTRAKYVEAYERLTGRKFRST